MTSPTVDGQNAIVRKRDRGVYYRSVDHPGMIARLTICVIDLTVLLILSVLTLVFSSISGLGHIAGWFLLAVCWGYLVGFKRLGIGTLGDLIFRVRVVNLHGQTPGVLRLTSRVACLLVLNPFVDLIWSASDRSKQPLWDKMSGTYVIRRKSVPAGEGEFIYAIVFILGMGLVFREVQR